MLRLALGIGLFGVVIALAGAAALAAADEPEGAGDAAAPEAASSGRGTVQEALGRREREARRRIGEALRSEVTLEFVDTPLGEALRQLAAKGEFPLWIDEAGLSEYGIAVEEPISVRLEGARIEAALVRILEPLALVAVIEDEVLKVTPEERAESRVSTRSYDVRRLLRLAEQAEQELGVDVSETRGGNANGGFANEFAHLKPPPPRGEWLLDVLSRMTRGEWNESDRYAGTARIFRDVLAVRQAQEVHEQIGPLLRAIEEAAGGELPGGSVTPRAEGYPVEKERMVYAALARNGEAAFEYVPLRSAIDVLGEQLQVPIIINEIALTEEGVSLEEPVSLSVGGVTLRSLLKLLLEPLGLTAVVRHGVVEVTTERAADKYRETAVYDVRDLHEARIGESELREGIEALTREQGAKSERRWTATMVPFPGVLIVRESPGVQAAIESLLAGVRETLEDAEEWPGDRPGAVTTRFYGIRLSMTGLTDQVAQALRSHLKREAGNDLGEFQLDPVGNTLVIRATNRTHRAVDRFLKLLHESDPYSKHPPFTGGSGMWHLEGGGASAGDSSSARGQ